MLFVDCRLLKAKEPDDAKHEAILELYTMLGVLSSALRVFMVNN